jgi:hypothetical protein
MGLASFPRKKMRRATSWRVVLLSQAAISLRRVRMQRMNHSTRLLGARQLIQHPCFPPLEMLLFRNDAGISFPTFLRRLWQEVIEKKKVMASLKCDSVCSKITEKPNSDSGENYCHYVSLHSNDYKSLCSRKNSASCWLQSKTNLQALQKKKWTAPCPWRLGTVYNHSDVNFADTYRFTL